MAREAFLALPLHLQQPPLPAVLCPCMRPEWEPESALASLEHVYCMVPAWLRQPPIIET